MKVKWMIHRSEGKSGRRITDLLCLDGYRHATAMPRHTGPVATGRSDQSNAVSGQYRRGVSCRIARCH